MSRFEQLVIGLDIGSTTVKAVVVDALEQRILWHDYQRHNTKQPEKVLEFLERIMEAFSGHPPDAWRLALTGSGSEPIAEPTGGKFVQEVNAVALAVERVNPEASSVVELGGQDAKIIMFKLDPETGARTAQTSMNDKCASGTGATIDKCMTKVGAEPGMATSLHFSDEKLHHVAAKCGVFAETDIVNLIKSGIPKEEVLNSLADAIVLQNLSVLTRGNTLRPQVLLLGGPNTYLPFLQECWRLRIPETWRQRGLDLPPGKSVDELIYVPENAELYAALGAALFCLAEGATAGQFAGVDGLRDFIRHGRRARLGEQAAPPLCTSEGEAHAFAESYRIPQFVMQRLDPGQVVRGVIGLDGGSTSSKAVVVSEDGNVLCKAYQLSKGNPIQDMKDLLGSLRGQIRARGAALDCLGFGATGYAADILEECLLADVNIVETVAHMMSAVHFFGEIDVVCDIGGQDIKVLFMKDGEIKGFRLGDGAVNFQSRVQMVLFKANQAARAEMDQALRATGLAAADFEEALRRAPRFTSALSVFPHRASTTAANLVYALAERNRRAAGTSRQRVRSRLSRTLALWMAKAAGPITRREAATGPSALNAAGAEIVARKTLSKAA